jgi:hypothetical protein
VTAKEMERLVGHLASVLMLRRVLLSALGSVYAFTKESGGRRQPLWPRVRNELECLRALLPLALVSWPGAVCAIHASLSGFGVTDAEATLEPVSEIGSLHERARFRGLLAVHSGPRSTALGRDDLDTAALAPPYQGERLVNAPGGNRSIRSCHP